MDKKLITYKAKLGYYKWDDYDQHNNYKSIHLSGMYWVQSDMDMETIEAKITNALLSVHSNESHPYKVSELEISEVPTLE